MANKFEQYLITGSSGQLGRELVQQFCREEVIQKPHEMLNVTDYAAVQRAIKSLRPDLVIHCAAITDPHVAQENPWLAWQVNAAGTDNIVKTCALAGVPLIYISSHHVFGRDEFRSVPLKETDPVGPTHWLGVADAAAEQAVLGLGQCMQPEYWNGKFRYWVLRTSELFGRLSHPSRCFAHSVMSRIGSMSRSQVLRLPRDITRSYTYVPHLARSIVWLAHNRLEVVSGVYHIANKGSSTPYLFGCRLLLCAHAAANIEPISITDDINGSSLFPKGAPRYTAFNTEKWHEISPIPMPSWEVAAEEFTCKSQS